MDAALRARLVEIVGEKAVDAEGATVLPGDAEQVEQACAACLAGGARIAVASTRPERGTAVAAGTVLVCLARLDAVRVEPERLVLRAEAGARLADVRAAAEKAGLALSGVPATATAASVGGAVARGQVSHRGLTGVEAVLPAGGRVGTAAGVLKDVAGYDLVGTLLGSMGRLALVTGVGLRLQPRSAPQGGGEPAGVPVGILGDTLERAFDPQRLLVAGG